MSPEWILSESGESVTFFGRRGFEYEIHLGDVTSAVAAMDFLSGVAARSWGTPEVLGNLVLAFEDHLLGGLRGLPSADEPKPRLRLDTNHDPKRRRETATRGVKE